MARKPTTKVGPALQHNAALEALYRRRLVVMVDEMNNSILYWIRATYRAHQDKIVIAEDASPVAALRRALKELFSRWTKKFDTLADNLAAHFAKEASKRSDTALKKMFKDAGWTVDFKMTRGMKNVVDAIVHENVQLIKSIPQQALGKVEGIVMRGVQTGFQDHVIANELEKEFKITRKRARFIAHDQSKKASALLSRTRQLETGITEAVWVHSGGGRHPRPTHVAAGRARTRFSLKDGWLDPATGKRIWPGTEINCRCVSRPVIPGLD